MKSSIEITKKKLTLNKLVIARLGVSDAKLTNLDGPTDKSVRTCASRFGIMICFAVQLVVGAGGREQEVVAVVG